jgi:hypothetical protein
MPDNPTLATLEREFECLLQRAGVAIPPERRAAWLLSYADLRSQIALLHGRYGPAAEPSNVFRLEKR